MRRNGTNNPREAKIIAKQKYAERQIDKWVKWSWEVKGRIRYITNKIRNYKHMKDDENKAAWSIELGFYPGFLIGIRSYDMEDSKIHVLYLPLIDIALTIYN
jgi:hypothetical protein